MNTAHLSSIWNILWFFCLPAIPSHVCKCLSANHLLQPSLQSPPKRQQHMDPREDREGQAKPCPPPSSFTLTLGLAGWALWTWGELSIKHKPDSQKTVSSGRQIKTCATWRWMCDEKFAVSLFCDSCPTRTIWIQLEEAAYKPQMRHIMRRDQLVIFLGVRVRKIKERLKEVSENAGDERDS